MYDTANKVKSDALMSAFELRTLSTYWTFFEIKKMLTEVDPGMQQWARRGK